MLNLLSVDVADYLFEFLDDKEWSNLRQTCKYIRNFRSARSQRLKQKLKQKVWKDTFSNCVKLVKRIEKDSSTNSRLKSRKLVYQTVYDQWIRNPPTRHTQQILRSLIVQQPLKYSRDLRLYFRIVFRW